MESQPAGLTIKNTFLDFAEQETPKHLKRSSSLPRSMKFEETVCQKYTESTGDSLSTDGTWDIDVCTVCSVTSESEFSVHASDSASNCGEKAKLTEARAEVPEAVEMPQVCQADAFQLLAMAALMAMARFQVMAELKKSCYGFQVIVKLPQHLIYLKEAMLQAAKVAVLQAAEGSESTYVVGYRNQPYMQSPLGFSCLMAHAEPSNACWDLLQWGSCEYQHRCRWEHPTNQATLNVMVVPQTE